MSADQACASQFCETTLPVTIFTSSTYGIALVAQLYVALTCVSSRYFNIVRTFNTIQLSFRIVWDLPEEALGRDGAQGWMRAVAMCIVIEMSLTNCFLWTRRTLMASYTAVRGGRSMHSDLEGASKAANAGQVLNCALFVMFVLGFRVSMFKPWCSAASFVMSLYSAFLTTLFFGSLVHSYLVMNRVVREVTARQEQLAMEAVKRSRGAKTKADDKQLAKLHHLIAYYRRAALVLLGWGAPFAVFAAVAFGSYGEKDVACRAWMRIMFSIIHLFFTASIVVHTWVKKEAGAFAASSSGGSGGSGGSGKTGSGTGSSSGSGKSNGNSTKSNGRSTTTDVGSGTKRGNTLRGKADGEKAQRKRRSVGAETCGTVSRTTGVAVQEVGVVHEPQIV